MACPENRSPRILEHIVCTDDGQIGFVALACGGGQFIRLNEPGIMLFGITGYEIGVGTKCGDGVCNIQIVLPFAFAEQNALFGFVRCNHIDIRLLPVQGGSLPTTFRIVGRQKEAGCYR